MNTTVAEIAALVGGRVVGEASTPITGLSGIREAGKGDLTFVSDSRYERHLCDTKAAAVLVRTDISECPRPLIQVEDPYAAFCFIAQHFRPEDPPMQRGIHPSAVIGRNVEIGRDVSIGAHVFVGDHTTLGDESVVYPNVYIGANCRIGARTLIYPNVSIRERVEIGARCILHSGAVIGSDGFGFVFKDGRHEKIAQTGIVVLGDDVEVGANAAIDRATFGKTVIGDGTKIDNLVQIGHNTVIGKHCILCGKVGISGSVVIGDYVTVAAAAGIAGHVEIGERSVVAGFSGVTKSIPPGSVVSGFPAVDHTMEKRLKASIRRLPDALRAIRTLEKRIAELETLLNAGTTKDHR